MKRILVSAGHSTVPPLDSGAVGNGFKEANETLRLRDAVAAILHEHPDLLVAEDGADGESQPLKKAIALARQADTAIEFHFNSGPATATGIEVLAKPAKKELAKKLARAVQAATGLGVRGEQGWKADNSGRHHRLGFCEAGGLIVEVAFISSVRDMKAYTDNFAALANELAAVLASA